MTDLELSLVYYHIFGVFLVPPFAVNKDLQKPRSSGKNAIHGNSALSPAAAAAAAVVADGDDDDAGDG